MFFLFYLITFILYIAHQIKVFVINVYYSYINYILFLLDLLFFANIYIYIFFFKEKKDLFNVNIFVYIRKHHVLNQNFKHSIYSYSMYRAHISNK